jgi:N-acetylglucosamine-6-phosphate deacetylase
MNSFKVTVATLYTGESVLHNKTLEVVNGEIEVIRDASVDEIPLVGTLVPGWIDVQINGGGDVLFNSQPQAESLAVIGSAHQKFGTTGWLPTLITDSSSKMQQAAEAVVEYRQTEKNDVLGIHFEGPFISTGKKGVHSESLIRPINDSDMALLTREDLGKVLVTVAPENVSTVCIKELTDEGVIVALGHSNASLEQAQQAIEAGATGFTHLYNAMSQLDSRQPGMVGAALTTAVSYSGIILDGVHVHPTAAKLAYHSATNLMLVTDAMPPVGSEKDQFEFFGQTIYRESDRLTNADGRLAGACLDMNTAVTNAMKFLDIDLYSAVDLATKVPAKFLSLSQQYGKIAKGYRANFVMLDRTNRAISTWIDGTLVN